MPSGTYALDPAHASLLWKVNHLGYPLHGALYKIDADIEYDNQKLMNSTVSVTVDPTSIETDYPNPEEKDFNKKLVEDNRGLTPASFHPSHLTQHLCKKHLIIQPK